MICDQCDAPFGPALPSAYCSDCMDSEVAAAVEAEREACARIADDRLAVWPQVAAAIRARGKPKAEAPLCTWRPGPNDPMCRLPEGHDGGHVGRPYPINSEFAAPPAQAGASPMAGVRCDPDPDLKSGTHYFGPGETVCECRKRVRFAAPQP